MRREIKVSATLQNFFSPQTQYPHWGQEGASIEILTLWAHSIENTMMH